MRHPGQCDRGQSLVKSSVSATIESMPGGVPTGGLQWAGSAQGREGGLGVDATLVRPGSKYYRGVNSADARFVDQGRGVAGSNERGELLPVFF